MKIAFIGHRKIKHEEYLKQKLYERIRLQLKTCPDTEFLFGSRSEFDALCLQTVTNLKVEFPLLKRVFVRAEYLNIDKSYLSYLLEIYDDTYFPSCVTGAGKASYIKRNEFMIDSCDFLFAYYAPDYLPYTKGITTAKSGTKTAIDYALKTNKPVVNFYDFCL